MDGDEIRRLRVEAGLTQGALAARLGVDQGTVSRWERGQGAPSSLRQSAILRALLPFGFSNSEFRQRSILRNNLMPVVTIDRTGHLVEASELAVAHYREKHGLDLLSRIGVSIKDHSHSQAMPEVWDTVKQSGVLEGVRHQHPWDI